MPGSFRMSLAAKKGIWEEQAKQDVPGPGNYLEDTSTFKRSQKITMGEKYRDQVNQNPGPGQYDLQGTSDKPKTVGAKIGTMQRTDVFGTDSHAQLPGPGTYASPERKAKGVSIGLPRE